MILAILDSRFSILAVFPLLADIWDKMQPGVIGWVGLSIVALAVFAAALFAALNGGRQFFARKPPLVDELARYSASVEQLKRDLAGMTPTQKFEALIEKLGSFATVTQVAALEISLEQQLKEVRGYAHDEAHGAIEHVNSFGLIVQSNSERIAATEATVESHDRWLRDVNTKLDRVVDRTADKVQELLMQWRNRGND